MKHIGTLLLAFFTCVCVAMMAAGCGDREFDEAAKQPPTVKYIAVDEDLNLLSNFIEERDLKKDGLNSNAYFLYGTADMLYFAVTSSDTRKTSTVYSYAIESREISTLFTRSGHSDQGEGEEYLFYVAMAKEDTVTCFYSRANHKLFGADEYYIRAEDYDLSGNYLSSKEYSAQRVFAKFSNDQAIRVMIQFDYLAGKSDCYWSRRSEPVSAYLVTWIHTLNGVTGSYNVGTMSSSDAMWNFIHSERDGCAGLYGYGEEGVFYQPYRGCAAFGLSYCDSTNKDRYVYFSYAEGGEPEYLFTRDNTPLLGLYIV